MTNVKPATDAQIANLKELHAECDPVPCNILHLIARVDADREENAYLKPRYERDMCADGHERIRYTPDEDFGPCPVCVLRAEISTQGRVLALKDAEIAALKAEVERLTPAVLPCRACGSKGFSDIVHGSVVLCDTCHGTGRAR